MALTDSVLIFFTTGIPVRVLAGTAWSRRYTPMDLGLLHRDGSRHADEGTGRVRRTTHRGNTVPHLDAPVAGLWQQGVPLRHVAVHSARRPLVCAHVPRAWRCLCQGAKAHTIGRFLSPMEGHQGTIFFYLPVILLGFFPLERAPSCPLYQTLKTAHS